MLLAACLLALGGGLRLFEFPTVSGSQERTGLDWTDQADGWELLDTGHWTLGHWAIEIPFSFFSLPCLALLLSVAGVFCSAFFYPFIVIVVIIITISIIIVVVVLNGLLCSNSYPHTQRQQVGEGGWLVGLFFLCRVPCWDDKAKKGTGTYTMRTCALRETRNLLE